MRVRSRTGQRGLSLIEVTIMLLVLMLLTSVLAPSIFDFVNDAQWVKVKEDCEAIAISVARLHRDVGARLYVDPLGRTQYPDYKLDLLVSDGRVPIVDLALAPNVVWPNVVTVNWLATNTPAPLAVRMDTCEHQLITNTTGLGAQIYFEPGNPMPVPFGPYFGQGWRGAYLSPPCASDPWGNMYQVNTQWATMTFGIAGPPGTTQVHCNDVFCISPGKDGIISTPYGRVPPATQGTFRGGDDWVTVIAPCDP